MDVLSKDKLAERVRMHLAAQSPSESGVAQYDSQGDNDQEKTAAWSAVEKALIAYRKSAGHGEYKEPGGDENNEY